MLPSRIIDRAANLHARLPAAQQGSIKLTYGEVIGRAVRLAGFLVASGLRPGDRVAILARNSFRYLEVNFACAYAGLILVPLNIRLAPREISTILALTEVRLLFQALAFDSSSMETLAWEDDQPPGAANSYESAIDSGSILSGQVERKLHDVFQIFFTSGTTGEPKGVCLTQQNMVASALDAIMTLDLSADDVWFHAPPMFHLVDAWAIWAMTLVGGRHVTEHFDPARFGATVEAAKVTKVSLPPTLLDMIARDASTRRFDFSSLERISYGGSPMPEAVYRRCVATFGCPLVQSYGTTETSGTICQQSPRDVAGKPWHDNVGQPVPQIDLRIVDDCGATMPVGTVGELAVSGPRVMAGYWRAPELTTAAIPDGWYRTGDLGRRDAEGYFVILGRKKDMIITGGENVYPTEVENALLAHPSVAEAAVFGIPNERWGEEVRAVVFLADGNRVEPADLLEHCRRLIGGYKVPKIVDISRDPLPKSGAGKIAKSLLRESRLQRAP
jgi:long-chain acyl-CoA synthetase